jgi:hypothetical protein
MAKSGKPFFLSLSGARAWLKRYHRAISGRVGPGKAACSRKLEKLAGEVESVRNYAEDRLDSCEEQIRMNRSAQRVLLAACPQVAPIFDALDRGSLPPGTHRMVLREDLPFKPLGDLYLLRSDFGTEELATAEEILRLREELVTLLENRSRHARFLDYVTSRDGTKQESPQRVFRFDPGESPSPSPASGGRRGRAGFHRRETIVRAREVQKLESLGLGLPAACYQLTRKRVPLPSRKLQTTYEGDWYSWFRADPRALKTFWRRTLRGQTRTKPAQSYK